LIWAILLFAQNFEAPSGLAGKNRQWILGRFVGLEQIQMQVVEVAFGTYPVSAHLQPVEEIGIPDGLIPAPCSDYQVHVVGLGA
jgi:hypothetical protein